MLRLTFPPAQVVQRAGSGLNRRFSLWLIAQGHMRFLQDRQRHVVLGCFYSDNPMPSQPTAPSIQVKVFRGMEQRCHPLFQLLYSTWCCASGPRSFLQLGRGKERARTICCRAAFQPYQFFSSLVITILSKIFARSTMPSAFDSARWPPRRYSLWQNCLKICG